LNATIVSRQNASVSFIQLAPELSHIIKYEEVIRQVRLSNNQFQNLGFEFRQWKKIFSADIGIGLFYLLHCATTKRQLITKKSIQLAFVSTESESIYLPHRTPYRAVSG
jgi:hypothetical protein